VGLIVDTFIGETHRRKKICKNSSALRSRLSLPGGGEGASPLRRGEEESVRVLSNSELKEKRLNINLFNLTGSCGRKKTNRVRK